MNIDDLRELHDRGPRPLSGDPKPKLCADCGHPESYHNQWECVYHTDYGGSYLKCGCIGFKTPEERMMSTVKEEMEKICICGHPKQDHTALKTVCCHSDCGCQKFTNEDMVNNPSHYGGKDNPYEHIKVVAAWGLDYWTGNATKYIARAGKKDPSKEVEDLKKAVFYLQDKIKRLEGDE